MGRRLGEDSIPLKDLSCGGLSPVNSPIPPGDFETGSGRGRPLRDGPKVDGCYITLVSCSSDDGR
jgi:hypothetical protein